MIRKNSELLQIQVGAFLVIGLFLGLLALFFLSSKSALFKSYYSIRCDFDDISGLRIGAPVQLAGINVGFIDNITFVERTVVLPAVPGSVQASSGAASTPTTTPQKQTIVKVRVDMKINSQYQERIRENSVASIVTQGLPGDRMIYITVGTQDAKKLKNGGEISEVKNPTGFTQLVEKGDDTLIQAKVLIQHLTGLTQNLNTIAQEVVHGDGLVHDLVFRSEANDLMKRVNTIVTRLDHSSQRIDSIVSKVDTGTGTLGALVNDASLYDDLKLLFGKANRNKIVRSVIRYTLQTRDQSVGESDGNSHSSKK